MNKLQEVLQYWNDQIAFVRSSSIGTPKKLRIDLGAAHNNLELDISGNYFYVIEATDNTSNAEIKVNETREPGFTFYRSMGLHTPFYRLIITNAAQVAHEVTILYGNVSKDMLEVIDNRGSTISGLDAIRDELRGDTAPEGFGEVNIALAATLIRAANTDRKSLIIQNKIGNTGNLYLGYDNTVAANKHFVCLEPGDAYVVDDYRGAIWGLQTVLNDPACYGEV